MKKILNALFIFVLAFGICLQLSPKTSAAPPDDVDSATAEALNAYGFYIGMQKNDVLNTYSNKENWLITDTSKNPLKINATVSEDEIDKEIIADFNGEYLTSYSINFNVDYEEVAKTLFVQAVSNMKTAVGRGADKVEPSDTGLAVNWIIPVDNDQPQIVSIALLKLADCDKEFCLSIKRNIANN